MGQDVLGLLCRPCFDEDGPRAQNFCALGFPAACLDALAPYLEGASALPGDAVPPFHEDEGWARRWRAVRWQPCAGTGAGLMAPLGGVVVLRPLPRLAVPDGGGRGGAVLARRPVGGRAPARGAGVLEDYVWSGATRSGPTLDQVEDLPVFRCS